MNRWLALAKDPNPTVKALGDTATKVDKSPLCRLLSTCHLEKTETENPALPDAPSPPDKPQPPRPAPSRPQPDAFPYGRSFDGKPVTWTGKVVSMDEWRRLSEWDKHGSTGKLFCGICNGWVQEGDFPHCHDNNGGAA